MLWISLIAIVTARILKNRKDDAAKTNAKKIVLLAAATAAILGAAGSQAQASRLAGDNLRETIGGRTVVMQAMGASMPITYRANGTMTGRMQGYVAAMAGESKASDSGKWWIKGGQLYAYFPEEVSVSPECGDVLQSLQIISFPHLLRYIHTKLFQSGAPSLDYYTLNLVGQNV